MGEEKDLYLKVLAVGLDKDNYLRLKMDHDNLTVEQKFELVGILSFAQDVLKNSASCPKCQPGGKQ